MGRMFLPVTKAACGRLAWLFLIAGMTGQVLASGMALAEESAVERFEVFDMPLTAIHDAELDGQFGFGLSAADRPAGTGERLAVILWDETKPRRPPPGIGPQTDSASAIASITVSSGGRYGQ